MKKGQEYTGVVEMIKFPNKGVVRVDEPDQPVCKGVQEIPHFPAAQPAIHRKGGVREVRRVQDVQVKVDVYGARLCLPCYSAREIPVRTDLLNGMRGHAGFADKCPLRVVKSSA